MFGWVLRHYGNAAAGSLLALGRLDLPLVGAYAVTLSSTYTFGDVFRRRHWLPS